MDAASTTEGREAHREKIVATVGLLTAPAVVSHMSAAVLHDLPLWNAELARVHLIRDRGNGGHIDDLVHLPVMPLAPGDVTVIDGIAVTSLARTVCDLARSLSAFKAVPIGDAALARGLDPVLLADVLARCRGWRGVVRARRTVDFLDARSESPGEFDGEGKYGALRRPDQTAEDVVLDEKAREDRLRDHGRQIARWTWPTLRTPTELRARIERAFARAR